jgi:signal transduction histidine kinase
MTHPALDRSEAEPRSGIGRFAPSNATSLTGDAEDTLTHLTRLTASALDVPIAYVALRDGDRFVLASHEGLDAAAAGRGEFDAHSSLSAAVLQRRTPVFITDPSETGRHAESEWLGNVAYAGMPLEMPDGEVIGTLSAAARGRGEWTGRDQEILVHIAAAVTLVLRIRETANAMEAMSGLLARMAQPIDELSGYIRSLTAVVASDADPRVRKFLALAGARVQAADAVMREVPNVTRAARARSQGKLAAVDVVELIRGTLASARAAAGSTYAHLDEPRAPAITALCDPLALQESLTGLLISLIHYAENDSQIHVRVASTAKAVRIDVIKPGPSVPAGDLTRMIGRFVRRTERPVNALRLVGNTVLVSSGTVSARTAEGRTAFRIRLATPPPGC